MFCITLSEVGGGGGGRVCGTVCSVLYNFTTLTPYLPDRNRAMFCITLSDVGGGFVGLYVLYFITSQL